MQERVRWARGQGMRMGRGGRWAGLALLYAGQLALGVLAALLFFDVVLVITPDLLGGRWPGRGPILLALALPFAMLALAFLTALPDALRTAFGRAGTDITEAGRDIATSYTGCILLICGLSIIALAASLPVLLVRLVFRALG